MQEGMSLAIQLAGAVAGIHEQESCLEVFVGSEIGLDQLRPLVALGLGGAGETVAGSEGCLSFPKLYAEIERPESVDVTATNEKGESLSFRAGGLLGRCIQHETDHLNGILFIDRMSRKDKEELKPDLDELQAATKEALKQAKR